MMNFKSYPNVTRIVIPDGLTLSDTVFYNTFASMSNLRTTELSNKVTNMAYAYQYCTNLTTAVCGHNVIRMDNAYNNCTNIHGNTYLYSSELFGVGGCFYGRNTSNILNIYVRAGSYTNTTIFNNTSVSSNTITGANITWTTDSTNNCFYNTTQNVYVYYVANVEEARIANGD